MPKEHVVRQGECISSLAAQHGYLPDTIWDDPANQELKDLRKDPEQLVPGDVVVLPDKRLEEHARPTGATHEFRRLGIPAVLRLKLFHDGKPRASEDYVLEIEGLPAIEGKTSPEGILTEDLPPRAARGKLTIGPERDELALTFGTMDPPSEISGLQKRLRNLGLYDGPFHGKASPAFTRAVGAFQALTGLPPTGEPDETTVAHLVGQHDARGDSPS